MKDYLIAFSAQGNNGLCTLNCIYRGFAMGLDLDDVMSKLINSYPHLCNIAIINVIELPTTSYRCKMFSRI